MTSRKEEDQRGGISRSKVIDECRAEGEPGVRGVARASGSRPALRGPTITSLTGPGGLAFPKQLQLFWNIRCDGM